MNILKEIILNQLIRVPAIKKQAKKYHQTGISHNPESLEKFYRVYTKYSPVHGKDILELGAGKTVEMVLKAREGGASSVAIADVEEYLTEEQINRHKVGYYIYDGKRMPFPDKSFDLVWSSDVFEHVRFPDEVVKETFRVLRPGGMAIHIIDLVDHFALGKGNPDITFNCLKYPKWLWRLMTWNRSNYVNRLRVSDWIRLHQSAGFEIVDAETTACEYTRGNYKTQSNLRYLLNYSEADAVSTAIHLAVKKQ